MSELFWVLLGFLLALIWDKYKDWQRFRFTIKLVANEVKEARTSLESKFKELPDDFKKIVKVAQEGGDISAHSSMLSKLPQEGGDISAHSSMLSKLPLLSIQCLIKLLHGKHSLQMAIQIELMKPIIK